MAQTVPTPSPPQAGLASIDFEIVQFVNDVPVNIPLRVRNANWGFVTRLLGLTMLSEREASAQIYRIREQALALQSSIPAREITDEFINWLRQFEELCKLKVYQSKLRPRGWINERMLDTLSIQETVNSGEKPGSGKRKPILPWGPI